MTNDLIYRSALLEAMGCKDATKYGNKTAEQQHNSYSTMMMYEIADNIDDAPAVDAEPVRHGRWIKKAQRNFIPTDIEVGVLQKNLFGYGHRTILNLACSECNKVTMVDDTIMYEFCPHCGAKMDLEGE